MTGSIWLMSLWFVMGAGALAPETYQNAVQSYQKKQYKQSARLFLQIVAALKVEESKAKKGSKSHTMLVLGQCDLYFYLGQIARHQKEHRRACRRLDYLTKRLASVPKVWDTWAVQPHLITHMKQAKQLFASMCPKVPSLLDIAVKPKDAKLSYRLTEKGPWLAIKGTRLPVYQSKSVFVRATKAGFKPNTKQVQTPRWRKTRIQLTLQKRPPPPRRRQLVSRTRPPTPPSMSPRPPNNPFYKTWWFWTVTGVAVVGVGTGVAIYFAAPRPLTLGSKSTVW